MKNSVDDDSSPSSEPHSTHPPASGDLPVANELHASANSPATSGLPVTGDLMEQERTVISHKPVAAPAEFMRSLSLVELARNLEGRQLHHFAVDRMIGGGGMGAVFHGRDLRLDREVAIKVIPESKRDPETLRRFRMEAQSAAKLDHPNIARVYDIGEDEIWNYIVFEFIDGINLRDLVLAEGPLSIDDAVYTTRQVAEALQHAHERDVVHRDIKPSNVIITPTGIAKVVDMGLARDTAMERSTADQTASGVTLGTFDYISPEQARDPRDADVRSDLYSLGCTMFFMLTGQPPFPDGTALQKLLNHGSQPHPDPRRWRDDISDELAAVLSKLMAKRPADRYQKPSELINDLLMIAQLESLPRARTAGAIVLRPTVVKRSLLEQHLPWLVPLSVVLATAFWLQSSDSFSAPFELPLPSFQPAPPISAELRSPMNGPVNGPVSGSVNAPMNGPASPLGPMNTSSSSSPAMPLPQAVPNPTPASPASGGSPSSAVAGSSSASGSPNALPNSLATASPNAGSGSATSVVDLLPKQPTLLPTGSDLGTLPSDLSVNELGQPNSVSPSLTADSLTSPSSRAAFSESESDKPKFDASRLEPLKSTGTGSESTRSESKPEGTKLESGKTDASLVEAWPESTFERDLPRDGQRDVQRETSRDVVRQTILVRRSQPSSLPEDQMWAPTLAAAIAKARDIPEIHTIELSESMELQEAISIPRSGLTLRAAAGQTVEIALSGLYAIGMGWESWFNIGEHSLQCEGLRILCCNDMRQPQAIFAIEPGGRLSLQDCLVTLESSLDTVPGACVLIKDRSRSGTRLPAAESGLTSTATVESDLTALTIKNSVVRGYQSLINMRVATKAEIAIDKVCAILEGRVLTIRGVESTDMPPVVRMSLNQSTLACQQGFALLQGGSGTLPPVTLMRSSKLCAYWSPPAVPHLVVEGVDSRERLRDLMQLRGEENAYDQNIGTLCQARLSDGSNIDFSFREAAGEWFVERYNDSSLRWQSNVPPDRAFDQQTAEDYRLRAGMFMPGYPPTQTIKN